MSYSWGSPVTDANINAATLGNSGTLTSAAINNNGRACTECGLTYTYASGSTSGMRVEIWRTYDGGSTFQVTADSPYAFNLPFTANTTMHYAFTVPGTISQFKVQVINLDSSHSITAVTLKTTQATN